MRHHPTSWLAFALTASLLSASALAAEPEEKGPKLKWQEGPGKISLADDVAQLQLQDDEMFLDAPQTIQLLKATGDQTSGNEAGIIQPASDDGKWWALFVYDKSGYVKDDDKDKINPDEILESYKKGTEEANEGRKEHGLPGLHVVSWSESPHYDAQSHNLVWAMLARDDTGAEVVNYQVRVLGREGVMAITLIANPKELDSSKVEFNKVLGRFTYQPGKTYAEWRPGDKVAEYGLTALVAAGAGAAAVKLGLLGYIGKFFKLIAVGVAAAAAAVSRFFKRLFGRGGDQSNPNGP